MKFSIFSSLTVSLCRREVFPQPTSPLTTPNRKLRSLMLVTNRRACRFRSVPGRVSASEYGSRPRKAAVCEVCAQVSRRLRASAAALRFC